MNGWLRSNRAAAGECFENDEKEKDFSGA